jgi:outer membrane lipoprotein-sorting protein
MLKFLKISIILFLFSGLQAKASNALIRENNEELSLIADYLQNIKYLSSEFLQTSPDSEEISGRFYLSRPGKMRIEYHQPSNILVVVNGSVLSYQDVELEEISYLRTNSTPASFLTRKNISFSAKDIEVTKYTKKNNIISVSLIKKNKKEAGEFTLVFQERPIKFLRMEVQDDLEQVTQITLKNHNFKKKIDNRLFVVKNNQLPQ